MFGFNKKKAEQQDQVSPEQEQTKKKHTRMDKLVMGTILGVAIGSVVGYKVMPKKGEKSGVAHNIEKDVMEIPLKKENFFSRTIRHFFERRKRKALKKGNFMKKIPNERD